MLKHLVTGAVLAAAMGLTLPALANDATTAGQVSADATAPAAAPAADATTATAAAAPAAGAADATAAQDSNKDKKHHGKKGHKGHKSHKGKKHGKRMVKAENDADANSADAGAGSTN